MQLRNSAIDNHYTDYSPNFVKIFEGFWARLIKKKEKIT